MAGGLLGGLSAHLAAGIGGHLESKALYVANDGLRSLAHGVAQGAISQLRGGRFREGFFSAVVGHVMPMPPALSSLPGTAGRIARAAFAGIAGGITTHLGGGKFANGAWSAAFVRLFNADGVDEKGSPITDSQRALLEDGDYIGFWKSRYFDSGDPVARTALIGWGHGDLVGAKWWEVLSARFTWNQLGYYIEGNGLAVTMDQLGDKLAHAHARAVTHDRFGVYNLLSPRQVADYHHEVFRPYGIPVSYFGGTILGNSPGLYSGVWCAGCDTSP